MISAPVASIRSSDAMSIVMADALRRNEKQYEERESMMGGEGLKQD